MSPAGSTPVFCSYYFELSPRDLRFRVLSWESPGTWKHMQGIGPTDREGMRKFSLTSEVLKWFGTGCTLLQQLPGSDQKTGTWSKELSFSFRVLLIWTVVFGVWVAVHDPMEGVWSMPVMGHRLLNRRVKPWLRKTSVLLSISSYFGWRWKRSSVLAEGLRPKGSSHPLSLTRPLWLKKNRIGRVCARLVNFLISSFACAKKEKIEKSKNKSIEVSARHTKTWRLSKTVSRKQGRYNPRKFVSRSSTSCL